MRVAAISFRVRTIRREAQFFEHVRRLVSRAIDLGATTIVLPELAVLELASLREPDASEGTLPAFLEAFAEPYVALLVDLAQSGKVTIVGGSHIERNRNVCAQVDPSGSVVRVEKHILTQWERTEWELDPGEPNGREGVAICYDCEFPELVRPLAERGIQLLCIPAYTETRHGFQRVRWSARARAVENQIFVAHASLVGSIGREPVVSTVGSSAILTPSNVPFPDGAVLAETKMNVEGIACADLDLDALEACRRSGDVRNWNDYQAFIASNRIG